MLTKGKSCTITMIIIFLIFSVVFLPGIMMEARDKQFFGKIQTEKVSSGRNALLFSSSLEERIELFCSSSATREMLFGWMEASVATDSKEVDEKVSMEYFYVIENEQFYEETAEELETLVRQEILPDMILTEENESMGKKEMKGIRFYLYEEEKDQGAMFIYIEKMRKGVTSERYIIDEESGKIIAVYLQGKSVADLAIKCSDYGKNYMDYLGLSYKTASIGKLEWAYKVEEIPGYYRMYADYSDLSELIIYPVI